MAAIESMYHHKNQPGVGFQTYPDHIRIVDFTPDLAGQAVQLAKVSYEMERACNPNLPAVDQFPDLTYFAQNGYGCAAFKADQMIGFLCFYPAVKDAFRTTNVKGTFAPIHAHGVSGENRGRVYSYLYQSVAKKLVADGILSQAISIYTHDSEARDSFFYNGFGLRCIDAIRPLTPLARVKAPDCTFVELPRANKATLLELQNLLIAHLGSSPSFMPFPQLTQSQFVEQADGDDIRYFGAMIDGEPVAYLKIADEGENFVCDDPKMVNICGAFCLPDYRGTGISHNLLAYLIELLSGEGYTRLGVDCESFNPTAIGFWLKYFEAYTGSLVRRIDDKNVITQDTGQRDRSF